jgi:hypothetical protein
MDKYAVFGAQKHWNGYSCSGTQPYEWMSDPDTATNKAAFKAKFCEEDQTGCTTGFTCAATFEGTAMKFASFSTATANNV